MFRIGDLVKIQHPCGSAGIGIIVWIRFPGHVGLDFGLMIWDKVYFFLNEEIELIGRMHDGP